MAEPAPPKTYEEKRLDEARDLLGYPKSADRLDTFAKFLIATTAVVGTLAAGLETGGLAELTSEGRSWFERALWCLAASLVLALLSLVPVGRDVNRYDLKDMEDAITSRLQFRLGLLAPAGLLFALALAFAGYAGIVTQRGDNADVPDPPVGYSLGSNGNLKVDVEIPEGGAVPASRAELRIKRRPPGRRPVVVQVRDAASETGAVSLSASAPRTKATRAYVLRLIWESEDEGAEDAVVTVSPSGAAPP